MRRLDSERAAIRPTEFRGWMRWLVRPPFVFLYICSIYLCFPSNHFNADALHYNLLAQLAAADVSALFRDVSTPVHLTWHLGAAALVRSIGTSNPLVSLFVLRLFCTVAALGSILLFYRLVRSFADELLSVCAMVLLAFSHAALRFFLSVEVYSLNNLVVTALLTFVYRCCSCHPKPLRWPLLVGLATGTAFAVATHLSNLLLVPVIGAFLFIYDWRRSWGPAAGYLVGAVVALVALALALGAAASMSVGDTLRYVFAYSDGTVTFVAPGRWDNLLAFLCAAPVSVLGSYGFALWIPLALALVFVGRHARTLWRNPFFRFLSLYLAALVACFSQWDAANIEHKIAILPILLLWLAHAASQAPETLGRISRRAVVAAAAVFVVVGFVQGIWPFRQVEDYELYRLSAEIYKASPADRVVVVEHGGTFTVRTVRMASQTFFGQDVRLLAAEEADFAEQIAGYRLRGYDVLQWDRSGSPRFRRSG